MFPHFIIREAKHMKKGLALVLSFVMVLSMLSVIPVTAFALDDVGFCGDNVTWSFDSGTGTLTLSGTGATWDYSYDDDSPFTSNSDITTVYIGAGITRIGSFLFFDCPNLESVTIGDTVVTIGEDAFCGCTKLSALSFGNGVKTLEFAAFGDCPGLVNLNLPDSLETIGNLAFDGCARLVNVVVPDSVKSMGNQAFYNCTALKTVSLGQVETIGNSAFAGCSALTEFVLPKSVTSVDTYILARCAALTSLSVDSENPVFDSRDNCNGIIETATNKLVAGCKNTVIPASVTVIGDSAFNCCPIESFTVPEGITTIEARAFAVCGSLKTLYLPKSLKSVESYAFHRCENLVNVYYAGSELDKDQISILNNYNSNDYFINANWHYISKIGDDVYYSIDGDTVEIYGTGAMYNYNGSNPSPLSDNTAIKTVNVGSGVTGVGDFLFYGCQNLTTVSLPDSIKTIGMCAFTNCFNLTTVNLPEGLTTIGTSAFQSCYNKLSEIAIPSTVTTIGNGVFMGCGRLTSITIPSGVTTISGAAFSDCTGLKTVTLDKNTTTVEKRAFDSCSALTDVYYTGSATDKDNMSISTDRNDTFINAKWHFNYAPLKGTGTSADPYQITDYAQLMTFAAIVNGGQTTACGKLMNDIVCKYDETDTAYAADWTPIGNYSSKYTGTFDGDGHTITGLTTPANCGNYAGLFGCVGTGGVVQNVTLEGGSITGNNNVGGIVGWLDGGTIQNCVNASAVTGNSDVGGIAGYVIAESGTPAEIQYCRNTGAVTAARDYSNGGGIVGYAHSTSGNAVVIANCSNTGAVSGPSGGTAGGIAGNFGTSGTAEITSCYNTGSVAITTARDQVEVGGIVGMAGASSGGTTTVKNCYNTAAVTATGNENNWVGGIVGLNECVGGDVTIDGCYNAGEITGTHIGGILGKNYIISGTGLVENCRYDSSVSNTVNAIYENQSVAPINVKGLATAQMTGEAANDTATMKALFDAEDGNGEKVWLDPKANGEDNGTTYLYYPHLKGFNYKSDGTPETDSAQISAVDWPAKVSISVTWSGADEYTYNASAQSPTVTAVTFGGKQLSASDYTVKYQEKNVFNTYDDVDTPRYAGRYKAIVTVTGTPLSFEKEFTINQAELIITPIARTYTYNGLPQGEYHAIYTTDLDKKVTVEGLQGADTLRRIELDGHVTTAGEHPGIIHPSKADIGAATDSYHITYKVGAVMMNQAEITITAASDSWTYDGDSHESTAVTVTSGTLCAGDKLVATATGSVKDVADTAAGNNPVAAGYKIMNGDEDVTANYAITAVAGTLTVTPRAITITAASATWPHDRRSHKNEAVAVTSGSLCTGDELEATATGDVVSVTDSVPGNNPVAAGYKILHGNTDVTANYDVTAVAGTLTVTPKDVTVKADDINIKYGDAEPTLTATVTGLVTGDTVDYDLTRAAGDDVGEYTITASGEKHQRDYKVTYQNGLFTITNADAPTLTADEKPTANTLVEDGTAQELVSAPASLPNGYTSVEYKLDNGDWSEDIPTASDAGDYNVHVRYIGDKNHTTFVGDSVSVHVKALYTVTWLNDDGSEFAKKTFAEDEEEPTVTDEPEKAADAQYTYTFQAWFKDDSSTVSNVIYNAIYTNTLNKYTVEFVDEDGTVLQSEEVEYGTVPAFNGEEPAKAADDTNTYAFDGWDAEIEAVTGDATYTATYKATEIPAYVFATGSINWTRGNTNDLTFKVNRSYDDDATFGNFLGIEIDGKPVDPSKYTATKGSVNVKLSAAFMNTLAAGEHTLKLLFTDGEAETTFTVSEAEAPAPTPTEETTVPEKGTGVPYTGDTVNVDLLLWVLLISFLCFASVNLYSLKKRGVRKEQE